MDAENLKMTDNQQTKLAGTIVKLYRTHWALFWRIMIPVVIIAIPLNIVQFFQLIPPSGKFIGNTPSKRVYTFTSNVNTISGIEPTIADADPSSKVSWQLYFLPYFSTTNSDGITWIWKLNFRSLDYTALILLLLTLCPLSLAVARISRHSEASDNAEDSAPLTAREMWRCTGRKAFTVIVAFLLFVLIIDAVSTLYALITWLIPSLHRALPFELYLILECVS